MISLFATVGRNLETGLRGRLPWTLPSGFDRLKSTISGKTVVMGSQTYSTILDSSLNGCIVFVVSRGVHDRRRTCSASSVLDAVTTAKRECVPSLTKEIVLLGGMSVFHEGLPLIDKAYITVVEGDFQADRFFPVGLEHFFHGWETTSSKTFFKSPTNPYQHTCYEFARNNL